MATKRRKGKHFETAGGLRRKTVYLPAELEERLRKAAFDSGRAESELLREALERYLDLEEGR